MNNIGPRIAVHALWLWLLMICFDVPTQLYASASGTAHSTREDLIGAWRLQSIQLIGPGGPMSDPFYNEGSTGILIYEPSGWMSVQIAGQRRATVDVPTSRPLQNSSTPEEVRRKAQALDTYYAYFGTWEFDEATSTVTHHIVSSLFPTEAGVSYSQMVTLDGDLLTFTTRRELAGGKLIQKKVWQRIGRH
jgi:Lipocalin-like domain